MPDLELTTWFDHEGNLMTAPASDEPTGFGRFDRLTHRIMKPGPGQIVQAISWCGRRVHEVPGHGEIDCAECLEILSEDDPAA
ncbi:hypothetical protein ACFV0B_11590 [Streptomyces xanthophaeus]|uniref:hypothetical protein n=1 Tax=Streptomyces xanthophaeus TaxID=67385 RepID=UPI0036B17DDD